MQARPRGSKSQHEAAAAVIEEDGIGDDSEHSEDGNGESPDYSNQPVSVLRALCRTAQTENANSGLREFLPWKAFRTMVLPLVVACSSAARSGTPCPPLELRPCCMSPERPF